MRNHSLLIVFLGLWGAPVFAQGGFGKRHFPKGLHNSVCRDVFEAPDGNIIGIGITSDSLLGGGRLSILGMDKNGNQKWIKSYGHPNMYFYDNDVHLRGPALYDSSGFMFCFWRETPSAPAPSGCS